MADFSNARIMGELVNRNFLLYPTEACVIFLARYFGSVEANASRRALDVGFGSGRHIRLLLDYGFQTYGIDYAPEALERFLELGINDSQLKDCICGDLAKQPFPEAFFDVMICWGVIFLRPREDMVRDLQRLRGLLKPGGKMLVNFRARENWFAPMGECDSGGLTHLDDRAGPYAGLTYAFMDAPEIIALLAECDLSVLDYEYLERRKARGAERHAWWAFSVERSA